MNYAFSIRGNSIKLFIVYKLITRLPILFVLMLFIQKLNAQPWMDKISKGNTNFYDIQNAFYDYYKNVKEKTDSAKEAKEMDGELAKFKRWEWFMEPRVYPSGDIMLPSKNWEEFQKYLNANPQLNQKETKRINSTAESLSGNWTSLGPFTNSSFFLGGVGRVDFIRFNPVNSNIIWAGAPSGGLWKSTDGGISWSTNSDLLTVIGCADLAINPTNTNIMYLATGDRDHYATNSIGVLKSIDGGVTWNTTGLSWLVNQYYRISKLLIHPTNPNIIFAATSNGIYKTTDAGVTWNLTQSGYFTDIEFKPGTPATVYGVTKWSGRFYKSTNTGTSFTNITSGLPASANIERFEIAITSANANYVYIIAVNNTNYGFQGLYRSTNSGTSFTTRSTTPDIIGGQGWYNLSIAVNPTNADDIYVGGVQYWNSIDGGITWSFTDLHILNIHPDVHAIDFLPGSSTTIFTCNDGGIYKSTNNATSWTPLCNGLAISQMYRLGLATTNSSLSLSGLQDNGTNRLNSNNWAWVLGGDGMECIVDYTNPDIMYAEYQYGGINKSVDGGLSFVGITTYGGSGIDANGAWITPYIMHPTNNNTLLVGKSQVYRTTDAGSNWAQVGSISLNSDNLTALSYAPSNPNYIYAASRFQFYTSINGTSFTNRTGILPVGSANITFIAVSNTNPNKVWITFSGYAAGEKVYMSNDAGVTWSNYSSGLPNLPANCIVYQNGSNDALYVGTDVGLYYRNNSMSTWQPYFSGLPNVIVNELEIHYGTGKIRAATYGRGLWESDIVPGCTAPVIAWIGMVSTAWENPANWSCGTLPDANTDVIINSGTVVLNSNTSIRSFTIKPGVNFTVTPGNNLIVNH